ncbi:hypothetical protein Zmor_016145 [Zophobas morio]|uniref:Uncharacterized protein n=1 Tax=Zophobas morio TaxID=2755281 RepID=A0AA38ING1_9CUCU|nr:hypothetical protein Zmor_016145 [Zophobas morio]
MAHPFQVLYVSQHLKFQMYLFNKYIEDVCFMDGKENEEENLVDDQEYQEEIKLRLKLVVRRHCEFKRSRIQCLETMGNLIIPFSVCVGVLLFMSMYTFLRLEGSETIVICYNAIATFMTISGFVIMITACETLQDESENTFTTLVMTKWYDFNNENRKMFLLLLCNNIKPISIDFTGEITVNYRLGMAISKAVYTAVSIFFKYV